MTSTPPPSPEAKRKKAFVLADALGLTRNERMEFASTLLWRDLISWKELDDAQIERLLDGLEGAVLVLHLIQYRAIRLGTEVQTSPRP